MPRCIGSIYRTAADSRYRRIYAVCFLFFCSSSVHSGRLRTRGVVAALRFVFHYLLLFTSRLPARRPQGQLLSSFAVVLNSHHHHLVINCSCHLRYGFRRKNTLITPGGATWRGSRREAAIPEILSTTQKRLSSPTRNLYVNLYVIVPLT